MKLRWAGVLLALGLWQGIAGAECPRIPRSQAVVRLFKRTHICPSTHQIDRRCPEIVDHIIPLCLGVAAGGIDAVSNMQYQSRAEALAKDKIERQMCRAKPRPCPHQGD
jgi:hypothetical protein